MNKKILFGLLFFSTITTASPGYIIFSGGLSYQKITGFSQTPAGGIPSTSDKRKPTYVGLGINKYQYIYDISVTAKKDRYSVYIAYQNIRMKSSTVLNNDLHTHGITFKKHDKVFSSIRYDDYKMGARYSFIKNKNLDLALDLSFNVRPFDYQIRDNKQSTDRNYHCVYPEIGLYGIYNINKYIAIQGDILTNKFIDDVNKITEGGVNFIYRIKYKKAELDIIPGISFIHFDFKDNQQLPNELSFNANPVYSIGIAIKI